MAFRKCSKFMVLTALIGAVVACDSDMYSDTTACRDYDASTVCPIDGSRDGPTASNKSLDANSAE